MLPTKFQVNWLFGLGEEAKKRFQDGHLGFPIGTILAIFYLPVTQMLPTKFQVTWPFSSRKEVKNRFSRGRTWRPSWLSNGNELSFFIYIPKLPTKFQVSWPFRSEAKKRFLINVQVHGQHPHQWAPFQIAGLLHAWQNSHQISRYVYQEGW